MIIFCLVQFFFSMFDWRRGALLRITKIRTFSHCVLYCNCQHIPFGLGFFVSRKTNKTVTKVDPFDVYKYNLIHTHIHKFSEIANSPLSLLVYNLFAL